MLVVQELKDEGWRINRYIVECKSRFRRMIAANDRELIDT